MMTYTVFLRRFFAITILLLMAIVGVNYTIDIFGLFRGKAYRKVYTNERTSKYLFSFRYIPENFDALLLGPSLSANINPEHIKGLKVYNASIMSANISELSLLVDNVLKRGKIKAVILCLDPYLTKDCGRKTSNMTPEEYWGALGSTNLLRTYLFYCIRRYNLVPSRYASNIHNPVGWNNFGLEMPNANAKRMIEDKVRAKSFENTRIDSTAYHELGAMLQNIRQHHIKIIGYFTPLPYQLYALGKPEYTVFENRIGLLFKPDDILLHLNDERYKAITSDYNTFLDHGHLNPPGQAFVVEQLNQAISQAFIIP